MIKVDFSQGYPSCSLSEHEGPTVTLDDLIALYQQCRDAGVSAEQAEIFEAGFIFKVGGEAKPYPNIRARDMAFLMVYGKEAKVIVENHEQEAEEWRRELGDTDPLEALNGAIDALKFGLYVMDIEDALNGEEDGEET